jgi:hypothetical protein
MAMPLGLFQAIPGWDRWIKFTDDRWVRYFFS